MKTYHVSPLNQPIIIAVVQAFDWATCEEALDNLGYGDESMYDWYTNDTFYTYAPVYPVFTADTPTAISVSIIDNRPSEFSEVE